MEETRECKQAVSFCAEIYCYITLVMLDKQLLYTLYNFIEMVTLFTALWLIYMTPFLFPIINPQSLTEGLICAQFFDYIYKFVCPFREMFICIFSIYPSPSIHLFGFCTYIVFNYRSLLLFIACLFICFLSVCLSVCLFIRPSFRLPVFLMYVCHLPVCLSTHLPVCPSARLSFRPCACLFMCLTGRLCVW